MRLSAGGGEGCVMQLSAGGEGCNMQLPCERLNGLTGLGWRSLPREMRDGAYSIRQTPGTISRDDRRNSFLYSSYLTVILVSNTSSLGVKAGPLRSSQHL